jgi:hypothetical protein
LNKIPFGSAWAVLPFVPHPLRGKNVTPWGIQTRSRPATAYSAAAENYVDELAPGTIVVVGDTVDDISPQNQEKTDYAQWVEILLPFKCYVNRIHFNEDSETLKRIG